jgi:hypothetical protein
MSAKNQQVAVVEPVASALPAFLAGQPKAKLQGLTREDYLVPRIKLLQGISDEVKDKLPGAEAGRFFLNVLDLDLGEELDFVIISNNIRVLLMAPRDDGQGILARADDGKTWTPGSGEWSIRMKGIREPVKWVISDPDVTASGLLEFGSSIPGNPDSNPAATKFFDYLVYLPKFDQLAVISLARSSAKKAKELNTKVGTATQKADMHGCVFRATPFTDNKGSDTFFNWRFSANGYVQSQEVYDQVKAYGAAFGTGFRVADEGGEQEGEGGQGAQQDVSGEQRF